MAKNPARRRRAVPRRSLFDSLPDHAEQNLYCRRDSLTNEASVESLFMNRLIADLGYADHQIKFKTAVDSKSISLGSKKQNYRPDYVLNFDGKPRIIIDAKSPHENPSDHIMQAASYAWLLNSAYAQEKPVQYFVLSNGILTQVFAWDSRDPILELAFEDFVEGNADFVQFRSLLSVDRFAKRATTYEGPTTHRFDRRSLEDVNAAFAWCHQHIYRKGNISQGAGFEEFVKVVFLKLLSDRRVKEKYPELASKEEFAVPAADVRFSSRWIKDREADTPNPLDTIQFHELLDQIEKEIAAKTRRRIFKAGDRINLNPEIIKGVVGRLEHVYLFGVDADLNGRLFETFLTATMRGKDLGQFFTPRSIVKLGTKLADIKVSKARTEVVLDACCGTGGFLIDALADMWAKTETNNNLGRKDKEELKHHIAMTRIYGVDIGREPNMARLARMNMYLHGDGGSSIYEADILDKDVAGQPNDSHEVVGEKAELRDLVAGKEFADVVLTNPPFAKEYGESTATERRILKQYQLRLTGKKGKKIERKRLRSSLMFMERYHDILRVGGRLVTVIDDGILSGSDYDWFRDFLRERFVIRAVVSLPGDAFQRSQARVKTSLLVLEKTAVGEAPERQGDVFMYPCRYVGIDDPSRRRVMPIDRENRRLANEEIGAAVASYKAFLKDEASAREYAVPAARVSDRMDVKHCLEQPGRNVPAWKRQGLKVVTLADLAETVALPEDDVIVTEDSSEIVRPLIVAYDGSARSGDEFLSSDTQYAEFYRVHTGDIVVSNISAHYGAVAVVPENLDGCVVTTEVTILRAKPKYDPRVIWVLLRSPEIRADLLLSAAGANRTRVDWAGISGIQMPQPDVDMAARIVEEIVAAERLEAEAINRRKTVLADVEEGLSLRSPKAALILQAFKPPK